MSPRLPFIARNWLPVEDCRTLVAYAEAHGRFEPREEPSRVGLNLEDLPQAAKTFGWGILERARIAVLEGLDINPEGIHLDHAVIERIQVGGWVYPHADNCQPMGGQFIPNHTAWRVYSGCLYLTECHGGELRFPLIDRMEIRCQSGTLVGFPAGAEYLHAVNPVVAGIRYGLIFWMTRSKLYQLEKRMAFDA